MGNGDDYDGQGEVVFDGDEVISLPPKRPS